MTSRRSLFDQHGSFAQKDSKQRFTLSVNISEHGGASLCSPACSYKCFTKSNVALNDLLMSFIVELEEFAADTETIFNDAEQRNLSSSFFFPFVLPTAQLRRVSGVYVSEFCSVMTQISVPSWDHRFDCSVLNCCVTACGPESAAADS